MGLESKEKPERLTRRTTFGVERVCVLNKREKTSDSLCYRSCAAWKQCTRLILERLCELEEQAETAKR